MSAAASPPGPAPMIPTLSGRSAKGRAGCTQPSSQAVSVMYFSTAPMVTVPWPACSMTQLPSHSRSCGQIRPQISGKVLVAWLSSYASRSRPSAVSFSQSGILLCSGQCVWQYGTPHCEHRPACSAAFSAANCR